MLVLCMDPPPQKDPNRGQPIQEGMDREFHLQVVLPAACNSYILMQRLLFHRAGLG